MRGNMQLESLTKKKDELDSFRPLNPALVKSLESWFNVELTYTSNAIEGNTLNRAETAIVVEKGLTVSGKSLNEHLEATNHARALGWVREVIQADFQSTIGERDILKLHEIVLKGIDDENAGCYRSVPVRISGANVILPNHVKVPKKMAKMADWMESEMLDLHPVMAAAEAHYQLVTIHPFTDGNGRTARLLMNLILLQNGYPPAIIHPKDRLDYINSLEQAQTGGSKDDYYEIIKRAVDKSLDIYLKAVRGEDWDEGDF